jgi:hypothetical protein
MIVSFYKISKNIKKYQKNIKKISRYQIAVLKACTFGADSLEKMTIEVLFILLIV